MTLFLSRSVATEKKQQKQQINSCACILKKIASWWRCVFVDDPLPRLQHCDQETTKTTNKQLRLYKKRKKQKQPVGGGVCLR